MTTNHPTPPIVLEDTPALAALRLSDAVVDALRVQGHVSEERRGDCRFYKLRFRLAGQQRVLYLGSDRQRAVDVEQELEVLQRDVRRQRRQAALGRIAAKRLQDTKHALQPLLAARGFYFHGLAVRKRRVSKTR
jgi:hypothetical protein